ncbi:MAG TPA: prepilin-type N-terminal cleavage/methylation domain-containing protein [Thermodesulfobacteriota bacterium]|nr:prepilin-type N-terminal cleavage/methylation domain-containing protein [Thermodesulfobacteriota bacterium]
MVKINNTSGFTLLEILVAVFIMSVGFLALSQMEFLSVRQKQMAEAGSNATNIIQAAADKDLAEIKRI